MFCQAVIVEKIVCYPGGGVLPSKRLLGMNLLISARPQQQTNAEGCRIFGDLDQLKSKDTIQKTVD